jgi:hypothetical protein
MQTSSRSSIPTYNLVTLAIRTPRNAEHIVGID